MLLDIVYSLSCSLSFSSPLSLSLSVIHSVKRFAVVIIRSPSHHRLPSIFPIRLFTFHIGRTTCTNNNYHYSSISRYDSRVSHSHHRINIFVEFSLFFFAFVRLSDNAPTEYGISYAYNVHALSPTSCVSRWQNCVTLIANKVFVMFYSI